MLSDHGVEWFIASWKMIYFGVWMALRTFGVIASKSLMFGKLELRNRH